FTERTTPAVCTATSTPSDAVTVPTASIPGVQRCGSTSMSDTVTVWTGMFAKNCEIIRSRKKLNQIRPPQIPATSNRITVAITTRFMSRYSLTPWTCGEGGSSGSLGTQLLYHRCKCTVQPVKE